MKINISSVEVEAIKSFPKKRRNLDMIPTVATRAALSKNSLKDSLIAGQKLFPLIATMIYALLITKIALSYRTTPLYNVPIKEFQTLFKSPKKTFRAVQNSFYKGIVLLDGLCLPIQILETDAQHLKNRYDQTTECQRSKMVSHRSPARPHHKETL